MPYKFNPFTGKFDYYQVSSGGGGGSGITSFNGRTASAAVPTAGDYDTFYYTKAQSDANLTAAAIGFLKDQGNFTPSGNYPSTGGSGTAGAILKGDLFTVQGLGVGITALVGSKTVTDGDVIRALVNTPAQTDTNWAITENNFGYAAENQANKATSFGVLNNTLYPTTQATSDYVTTGTLTLTNKTLTSPIINVGSDLTGDIYYRNAGVLTRLAGNITTNKFYYSSIGSGSNALAPTLRNFDTDVNAVTFGSYTAVAGIITVADTSLTAIQKLDVNIQANKAVIPTGSSGFSFGDSIMAGYGISASTKYFINIFADQTGTTITNYGLSSSGGYVSAQRGYQYITNPSSTFAVWEAGLNDMRASTYLGVPQSKSYEKVKGALRAFLANQFLATGAIPASSGSITRAGTWTAVTAGTIGEKAQYLSGTALRSTVVSSTLTYTFTGDTIVIGTHGTDDVNQAGGVFTVAVDGTVMTTFDNRGKADGITDGVGNQQNIIQNAIVLQNLGTGSHTLLITVTTLSASGAVYIDYIGQLQAPQSCKPVIVMSIPKLNAAGYATGAAGANDAVLAQTDLNSRGVMAEFANYPTTFCYTNNYYNIATGLSGDNIHPNDTGAAQISRALLATVAPFTTSGSGINNQTSLQASANFNISGIGQAAYFQAQASGSGNMAYFGQFGDATQFAINRNPITGAFNNTGKASAQISVGAASGIGQIVFFTTNTNNIIPIDRATIDGNGQTNFYANAGSVLGPQLRLGTSSTDDGGMYLSAFGTNIANIICGARHNGSVYTAKATTASNLSFNGSLMQLLFATGLTINSTFSYTQVGAITPVGLYIGGTNNTPIAALHVGAASAFKTITSSAASLTLDKTTTTYIFTGTTTTWTLPAVSGNTDLTYFIKNRGSGAITLQRAGADSLYETSIVTSITINAGEARQIVNDGTYYCVL